MLYSSSQASADSVQRPVVSLQPGCSLARRQRPAVYRGLSRIRRMHHASRGVGVSSTHLAPCMVSNLKPSERGSRHGSPSYVPGKIASHSTGGQSAIHVHVARYSIRGTRVLTKTGLEEERHAHSRTASCERRRTPGRSCPGRRRSAARAACRSAEHRLSAICLPRIRAKHAAAGGNARMQLLEDKLRWTSQRIFKPVMQHPST